MTGSIIFSIGTPIRHHQRYNLIPDLDLILVSTMDDSAIGEIFIYHDFTFHKNFFTFHFVAVFS